MMKKNLLSIFLLSCLRWNVVSANDAEILIKQAQTLITAQQHQHAYELLTPVADEYAGNPKFDTLYGVLLLKLKHNTRAVFALERALMMRPQHLRTQKALVTAYERLNDFDNAERLFKKIQQHPESKPQQTKNSQKKADKIYKISGFLGASVGYDDNLTNGPDDNFIRLPLAEKLIPFFSERLYVGKGLEKDQDFFSSVSGGVGIKVKLPENFGLNAGLYGNRRINDTRHDEDASLFSSWIGGQYQWGRNRFNLTLKQQTIWLSDEHYQDQYSLLGQWSRSFYKSSLLSLYANGKLARYPDIKHLDTDAYSLGAVFYQQFSVFLAPQLSFEVYGGEDQISDSAYDYLGYAHIGVRLGSQFKITASDLFFINAGFEHRRYKADNPFFLLARDDRRYTVTGRYTHYFFNNQLGLSLQGTWQLNESSIELYDTQRNFATVSFQWNF